VLLANLGRPHLFEPDEGRNGEKAREILLLDDWVTPHENFLPVLDKPMPFYWLVAASYRIFGMTEWSARFPSAMLAMGCLFLVYRLAGAMERVNLAYQCRVFFAVAYRHLRHGSQFLRDSSALRFLFSRPHRK
jgi:4-amino-4-deoxy-L-arabinose transferase-like glycosyltransferase